MSTPIIQSNARMLYLVQWDAFLYDVDKWATTGKFFAVAPVYPDLMDFFQATKPEDIKKRYVEFKGE